MFSTTLYVQAHEPKSTDHQSTFVGHQSDENSSPMHFFACLSLKLLKKKKQAMQTGSCKVRGWLVS